LSELSGGERQLVFIARTLSQDSEFVLLDEPYNNLDPSHKKMVWQLLLELKKRGIGGIMVTHEMLIKKDFFDQVLALNREGRGVSGRFFEIFNEKRLSHIFGGRMQIFESGDALIAVPHI
jgi:iron complex transport system ATP-binding protein